MAAILWTRLRNLLTGGVSHTAVADLEQVLLEADFGPTASFELIDRFEARRMRAEFADEADLHAALVGDLTAVLAAPGDPGSLDVGDGAGPGVVLLVGVNGVGKTTTLAKLAAHLQRQGRRVLIAAADTYRPAAVEQLQIWANQLDVPCVAGAIGGDPAAVVFDAIAAAEHRNFDVVLADTAGRLHTKDDLMDELRKVVRVAGKRRAGAPHEALLIVDGTTGQNVVRQGRAFRDAVPLTGAIVTKLDGTARGGAVVALRRELDVPIRFLGVGERLDDLVPFDARAFAERLVSR